MPRKRLNIDALRREKAEIAAPMMEVRFPGVASQEAEERLLQMKGVEGIGRGEGDEIAVFVSDPAARNRLPNQIEGHRLVVHLTGPIKAL